MNLRHTPGLGRGDGAFPVAYAEPLQNRLDLGEDFWVALGLRNVSLRSAPRPVRHHHADEVKLICVQGDAWLRNGDGGRKLHTVRLRRHLKRGSVAERALAGAEDHPVIARHPEVRVNGLIGNPLLARRHRTANRTFHHCPLTCGLVRADAGGDAIADCDLADALPSL